MADLLIFLNLRPNHFCKYSDILHSITRPDLNFNDYPLRASWLAAVAKIAVAITAKAVADARLAEYVIPLSPHILSRQPQLRGRMVSDILQCK